MLSSIYGDLLDVAETLGKTATTALNAGDEVQVQPQPGSNAFFTGTVIQVLPDGQIEVENERTGRVGKYPKGSVNLQAELRTKEEARNKRDADERAARIEADREKEERETAARPGESPDVWLKRRLEQVKDVSQPFITQLFEYVNVNGSRLRVHYVPHSEPYAARLFEGAGRPELADQVPPYEVGRRKPGAVGTWGVSCSIIFPIPPDDPDLDLLLPWPDGVSEPRISQDGKSYVVASLALTFELIRMGIRSDLVTK